MVVERKLQRLTKGSEFLPIDLVTGTRGFCVGRFLSTSACSMIMETFPHKLLVLGHKSTQNSRFKVPLVDTGVF